MGVFDELQKANPGIKVPSPTSSANPLDALQAANPTVTNIHGGGYVYQNRLNQALKTFEQQQAEQVRASEYHPGEAFWEAMGTHTKKKTEWMPSNATGETIKETWGAVRDATKDLSVRAETAFAPVADALLSGEDVKKADIAAGLSSLIIGGINVAFSPVTGYMKGIETVPVLGHVASIFNKLAYGLGGAGAETFGEALESAPFIDEETKIRLRPAAEEIGGIVGMIFGFKAAGKATGKVMNTEMVRSNIAALERKSAEIGEILSRDPNLRTQVAQFVAERGPVRQVPVTSETPGVRSVIEPKPRVTPDVVETPKTPAVRYIREEKSNYPGKTVQVTTDGMNEPGTVVSVPSTSEVVVRVQNGDQITVPSEAVRDIRSAAEVIQAARERAALETTAPTGLKVTPAPPPKPTKAGEEMRPSATEVQTSQREGTAPRQDLVTSGGVSYQLSGRALTEYQARLEAHNRRMTQLQASYQNAASASMREQAGKQMKAEGMQWSAYIRELTGKLTDTELKNTLKREKSNYVGKEVLVNVNGKWVKATIVSKPAFGNIKVRLKNGKEITVKTEDIKDPRTDAEIKENITKREDVKEYDATAEEAVKPTEEPTAEPAKAPNLSPQYNEALVELELAEAGYRYPKGDTGEWAAVESSFPSWIPKGGRTRAMIDKFLKGRDGTTNDLNIKYKKGSVLDRMQEAFNEYVAQREMQAERSVPVEPSTVGGQPVTLETTPEAQMGGGGTTPGRLPGPIAGTGKERIPGLTQQILTQDFVESGLAELPVYRKMNMEELANKITRYTEEELRQMLRGERDLPSENDIPAMFIWRTLYKQQKMTGDIRLAEELAYSDVSLFGTRAGQELRSAVGREPDHIVDIVQEISKEAKKIYEKSTGKDPEVAVTDMMNQIKKAIMDEKITSKDLADFLKDVTCP